MLHGQLLTVIWEQLLVQEVQFSVQTDVPGTCISDSGTWVKINCFAPSPSQPTKSGVSSLYLGIGAMIVIFVGMLI